MSVTFGIPIPGVLTAHVHGAIVLSTAADLDDKVRDQLSRYGPRRLVLDLEGVWFVDTAGIAVLARTRRRAGASGAQLSLVALGATVVRALRFADALSMFTRYPDLGGALAASAGER